MLGLHGRVAGGDWDGGQVNAAIVAYLGSHPEIDPMRICLTGVSLGGRGVLRTALHRREHDLPVHSCAVFCPVPGGFEGNPAQIARLQTVPIYFFASPKDRSVPYDSTVALQSRMGDQSSRLRTIAANELRWPNSAHVCWTNVYGHPALYDWRCSSRRRALPTGRRWSFPTLAAASSGLQAPPPAGRTRGARLGKTPCLDWQLIRIRVR